MKVWFLGETEDGSPIEIELPECGETQEGGAVFCPSPLPATFRWVMTDGEVYDLTTGDLVKPGRLN